MPPFLLIILGLAIMAILLWIFWPKKGLLVLLSRMRLNSQRVQLEDALKFLFDCEYKHKVCDINSIAGNLQISADKASKLLERMHKMDLIKINDHLVSLTDTGRSYSLRVIRVHRIWERYLADETGVAPIDWHHEADQIEHMVTREDTEKIAAQLGHPVFDPHGDPIPTVEGELPLPSGQPLSCLHEGDIGRIVHIEDEPKSIYEQLVVQGVYPGMQVFVIDTQEDKITVAADGEELTLTPLFANQLTVEVLSEETTMTPKYNALSSLKIGEEAEVIGISPNCRGQQRRRLMDLGFVPGSQIKAEIRSASGDPVGYRVMGATIGIRKQQADLIFIRNKKLIKNE